MQIILVHPRLAKAKTLNLKTWHFALGALCAVSLVVASSALLSFLFVKYGNKLGVTNAPILATNNATELKLRQELKDMAAQVGQMQVKLMQLDALGERVAGLANIKPQEFNFKQTPGSGGLDIGQPKTLSSSELQTSLAAFSKDLDKRDDFLKTIESTLLNDRLNKTKIPTVKPVANAYTSSGFGWRIDPVHGSSAFHSGLDFPAVTGTPIVAAADGVVIAAEHHPQYGNMIDIAHSDGLSTRYAHSSKLYVKLGDIVKRGQTVAAVGSTGKSTGPHLHFEVRVNDIPQNPMTFLKMADDPKLATTAPLEPTESSAKVDFTPIPIEKSGAPKAERNNKKPSIGYKTSNGRKIEIFRSPAGTDSTAIKAETKINASSSRDNEASAPEKPAAPPAIERKHQQEHHSDDAGGSKHSAEVIM